MTGPGLKRSLKLIGLLIVMGVLAYAGTREIRSRMAPGERLAIRWEGLWIDNNHRDLGASMNACLGQPVFAEGVVQRSNVWFSGWSCDGVGSPDVIYSFNRSQKRHERYFCRTKDGEDMVGRFFQDDALVLSDLEFLTTWDDPKVRSVACAFFTDSYREISQGRRILAHCDAGKDRTGTYSALTAALAAEMHGSLDSRMIEAIECDYQKSESLEKDKYGRMQRLLTELQARGGVERFFVETCQLDPAVLRTVADRLYLSL